MEQLTSPIEIVKKSNALARARWSANSIWEPRLVALLASKIRTDDLDFQVYEIPVSEVMREKTGGKDYKEIETVVDKVMSRILTIRDNDGWTKYNVFSRCRYRKRDRILELGFHPDLRHHYLNLQKNFAKFNLLEFLMLPSVYSQRIFEFLKSWDDKPETTISIADLHEMLDTPDSLRKDFRNFRLRVLEKAHKDITQKTQLAYEWEPLKQGRAVVAVRFTFSKKRALPIARQKANDAREKQIQSNNAAFLAADACFKKHGQVCTGGHNKKAVCSICYQFRSKEF